MSSPQDPHPGNAPRAWKACESCRKKKTKCDGKQPCSSCGSRKLPCIYSDANDNAAKSRQDTGNLNTHYEKLDVLYERMEQMMDRLSTAVGTLEGQPEINLRNARTLPALVEDAGRNPSSSDHERSMMGGVERNVSSRYGSEYNTSGKPLAEHSSLVPDSNNIYRYIGGVSNTLSVNVIESCGAGGSPLDFQHVSPSKLASSLCGTSMVQPLRLRHGPSCKIPPRYMSDVLVGLFFTRLNATFPILNESSFASQYRDHLDHNFGDIAEPSPFRSVLFAVYACASNLLAVPRQQQENQQNPAGLEYFEQALSDHYQNFGQGGLEEVQCLAILAVCLASWNRLTESWKLSGQAVRAAQDLGLHINFANSSQDQTRSCVWWSVYTLDSVLSACLGRQMAVTEADHDCPFPDDIESENLAPITPSSNFTGDTTAVETSQMAGFIALAQVCQILNKINRSAQVLISDAPEDLESSWTRSDEAAVLELQLTQWIREKLPPSIQFAANRLEAQGGVLLAMCVLTFMLHALAVINLNLPLIGVWDIEAAMFENEEVGTGGGVCKVITAARGIIRASELVSSNIPPSHYLAFCVHLIQLAGFILLKAFQVSRHPRALEEVQACVTRLAEVETVCPGAVVRGEVLARLLQNLQAN